MASDTQVRFPEIHTQGIYASKYRDWNPTLSAAGKLTATGDSAQHCLKPSTERPESPESVRRFRRYYWPEAGVARVNYGTANDLQRIRATEMSHGVSTQPSFFAGDLVNPQPKTLFQQRFADRKENLYQSHIKAPLGRSHDQRPGFPKSLDPYDFTFGLPTELDVGAGGLINPNKSYAQVETEDIVGHDLYVKTHNDFDVGEQVSRSYTHPTFISSSKFGIPTPHFNDGLLVRKTLKWLQETESEKAANIVSKRVSDFHERTQPQLGQVHDPIKETLNVADDHMFGILIKPDAYGAGDLIHQRMPGTYLRGKDRLRGILSAIRQHLKKSNYHNFQDLMAAFKHYDKEGKGKLDMSDLREACTQFHLPVEPELLEQLIDYCDSNHDGFIDYLEFANFLNWKDKMPTGLERVESGTEEKPSIEVVSEKDLVPKSPQSQENTPRRLQKQVDKSIGQHRTSANMINAVVGGVSTKGYRTYGVPTVRSDLPGPRIRRIDDKQNYGDESDAYGLVNPSLYSQKGVYERDFLIPRTREQLQDIFTMIGIKLTINQHEEIYNKAASQHPKGLVCVEAFRNVLDELYASNVIKKN